MSTPANVPGAIGLPVTEAHAAKSRAFLEEVANAMTHGLGLLAGLVLSPFFIGAAPAGAARVSVIIYCTTMVMLFGASTLYHAVEETRFGRRWSNRLQVLDHVAIYLFIAGAYTPYLIISMANSSWKVPALVTVWTIAVMGVLMKLVFGAGMRWLSVGSYLLLGWISIAVVPELITTLTPLSSGLLVLGGLFYTGGVWFYWRDDRLLHHAIWHVFVLAGTACHAVSIAIVL